MTREQIRKEKAFIDAINDADLADVTSRLIYADWLEEQGRTGQATVQREIAQAIETVGLDRIAVSSHGIVHYGAWAVIPDFRFRCSGVYTSQITSIFNLRANFLHDCLRLCKRCRRHLLAN